MTTYNVHIYREMRLTFGGIDADSDEAAASIARDKPTADADAIDDCEGETLSALVDVVGDEQYEQSRLIDFAPERLRTAAPKLLGALKYALEFLEANEDGEVDITSRITAVRAAITDAEAAGILSEPPALTLLAALDTVLPYAENEAESLYECSKRDGDLQIKDASDRCERAIENARAAIAQAKAARIPPAPADSGTPAAAGQEPARFEIEHNPEENPDRVYVLVDGKFDVAIIRTDEGVVVDVYPKHGFETLATTYAFDSDAKDLDDNASESDTAQGGNHEPR